MDFSLSSERATRIEQLFDEAVDLTPEERAAYLDQACRDDADLRREVASLLAAFDAHAADVRGVLEGLPLASLPPAQTAVERHTRGWAGQRISHYQILEQLGGGGMGVVYKARDTRLDRTVALKFLPPHLNSDEAAKRRFVQEAKAASALDHVNICTIYEIDETPASAGAGGQLFIAMAFYAGETLKKKVERGPLPVEEALTYAVQMAEGLSAAHAAEIVHRDVKPANVMVTSRGEVKLVDFGLAKVQDVSLTQTGMTLGTVAYMSPEQARGEQVDHRTDIWSLGVVLYEMLTGERPFRGDHPETLLYAIRHEEPASVLVLRPEVPEQLVHVVEKLLRKDPAERYQDAFALLADLSGIREGKAPAVQRVAYGSRRRRVWMGSAAAVVLLLAAGFGLYLLQASQAPQAVPASSSLEARKMIVVLPLENLGPSDVAYFAAGMTEEITSRLASVSTLGVIARSSARHYAGTDKPLRQIGQELGVEYVLEGTVRWAGAAAGSGRVRITPHLVRVTDGMTVWSDTYEREMADVFAIQAEIAEAVVEQLGVRLQEREQEAVEERPTESLAAYHAYLRGQFHASDTYFRSKEHLEEAIAHFEQAVALDSTFVLAYAELTEAHSRMIRRGYDVSEERHRMALEALEQALALAPEAPEVQLAVGQYHYFARMDFEQARPAFEKARRSMPGHSEPLAFEGSILLRQGHWEQGLTTLEEAFDLDPLDPRRSQALCWHLARVRRYQEAAAYCEQTIAVAPDEYSGYLDKAQTYWIWRGDVKAARAALEAVPAHLSSQREVLYAWFWQELYEGNYRAALGRLSALDTAVDVIQTPRPLLEAFAYALLEEPEQARRAFETARDLLERELVTDPKDVRRYPVLRSALGLAYAGLGRREEAVREGEAAVAFFPVSKDAVDGANPLRDLALIYTMVGEQEAALDQIERLLSIPSRLSVPLLQLDPRWGPLHSHPRFQALLKKTGLDG